MAETGSFNDIPVSWQVDDIAVDASLTLPKGTGPFPAVLMVAGSGPTDRNWNSPLIPGTNGSAALLAQVLTEAGFATLRYDKRASGPHGQENAARLMGKISMQGHIDELAGGMRLLAGHKAVDRSRIFALTNSEGCIHALNYQLQAGGMPFAGLVLTSAPARPIAVVAHDQLAAQLTPVPGGDQMLAAYDEAIQDFAAGREVKLGENMPEGIRNLIMSITSPINQPFSRELWFMDVSKLVEKVDRPILIVLGKKDIQVNWQSDGSIFEEMVKKQSNVRLAFVEDANHVLKYEPTPWAELNAAQASATYNAEGSKLDEHAVESIISWLKSQ
jgi:pimeloyl-ACP methyl ester carboxylesterase